MNKFDQNMELYLQTGRLTDATWVEAKNSSPISEVNLYVW